MRMANDIEDNGVDAVKVIDIETFLVPDNPSIPVISLKLEDGDEFYLYNVPYDIIDVIKKIREDFANDLDGPMRESIFDLLSKHDDFKNLISEDLDYVIVDEYDPETMLFTAKVAFSNGGARIVKRMVPSHAIFLALIAGKPIYVTRELVEFEKNLHGEE